MILAGYTYKKLIQSDENLVLTNYSRKEKYLGVRLNNMNDEFILVW